MSVLAATDLRISYNGREVVHGVSFEIEEGETLALVGESGSGKSTTAHAILGLLPSGGTVDGGSVVLGDLDISGWTDRALRGIRGAEIGLVPQDPTTSLDPCVRSGRRSRRSCACTDIGTGARVAHG